MELNDDDVRALIARLRETDDAGVDAAVDAALSFLEADPWYFRSGYHRNRLAGAMAGTALSPSARARARSVVLGTVDGRLHRGDSGLRRLAGAVADNELRRALRARLHHSDPSVVRRAAQSLTKVRHPGLTPSDLAAVRAVVLHDAGLGRWLSPATERLATWAWDPAWEAELRASLVVHGPERTAARRLIDRSDERRARRARRAVERPGP